MEPVKRPCSGVLVPSLFITFAAITAGLFLAREWRPSVASEHGAGVDGMITYLLVTTGTLFVVGHTILALFVWRYSGGKTAPWKPVSRKAEWAWTILPVLLMTAISEIGVLVIGMPVWGQIFREDPDALQIEITGKQFEWISRYPGKDGVFGKTDAKFVDDAENPIGLDPKDPAAKDDIIERGVVVMPVGRPVSLRIRSRDVLHSFAVPLFRTKQDAVPGLPQRTRVVPTQVGKFEIACAELCGLGHYRMRGFVIVKPKEDFDKWLAAQAGWFE